MTIYHHPDLVHNLGCMLSFWPNNMKKHLLLEYYETKLHFVGWCKYLLSPRKLHPLFFT